MGGKSSGCAYAGQETGQRQPSAVVARSGGACHVKDAELGDEP
jgi:hypothetical protein